MTTRQYEASSKRDPLASPGANDDADSFSSNSRDHGVSIHQLALEASERIQDESLYWAQEDPRQEEAPTKDTSCSVFLGAVSNLCSATLGAGVLALPYAFEQAGLVVGGSLLVASAVATVLSVRLLAAACDYYACDSYESLTERLAGKMARRLTEASIVVFCLGCAVAYCIAVGDILQQAGLVVAKSRELTLLTAWAVAMLPLSMLKTMAALQGSSTIGVASIMTLVFSAIVHWMDDVKSYEGGGGSHDNSTVIGNATAAPEWHPEPMRDFLWPADGGIVSVLTACPIVLFAFSCQVNVCAIYQELPVGIQVPTSVDACAVRLSSGRLALMSRVAIASVTLCAALYASISLAALADFGSHVESNLLKSYRAVGMMQVAMLGMAVAVVMAFPLNIFPARVALQSYWKTTSGSRERRVLVQGDENLTAALLQDNEDEVRSMEIQEGTSQNEDNHDDAEEGEEEAFSWIRHIVLTLLLSGSALGFALVVPDISTIFGLLGGTTSSLLGFCIPGWLGLRLAQDTDDPSWLPISYGLLVGGAVVGLLTTGVTLYGTIV